MGDYQRQRDWMVDRQIIGRGIRDQRLLDAMCMIPRERFVDAEMADYAYDDAPLPIDRGQTISQPFIVAAMIEAAEIESGDRVLKIGAGSGYAAAVMSRIARQVYAIERHPELAYTASRRLEALGYHNVELRVTDGTLGWPEAAPYNAILVAAGGPEVPRSLAQQLTIGGHLVIPIGEETNQRLLKVTRCGERDWKEHDLGQVRFVPLVGEQGWADRPDLSEVRR